MNSMIKVKIDKEIREIEKGTTLRQLLKDCDTEHEIVAAIIDNKVKNVEYPLNEDTEIKWIDRKSTDGYNILLRTATLIFLLAAKRILPDENMIVEHPIGNGLYIERRNGEILKRVVLEEIEKEMKKIIEEDLPIERKRVEREIALSLFEKEGYYDKIRLMNTLEREEYDLYIVGSHYFSFHGYLAPSTGYIDQFALHSYYPGTVLLIPNSSSGMKMPLFKEEKSLAKIFEASKRWTDLLDIGTVGSLNEKIINDDIDFLIHVSEAYFENQVSKIAENIVGDKSLSMVLIAGPSSSGKTTLAKRLAIQLGVHGLKPIPLSMDDYFVDRHKTPLDEEGKKDFESVEAIDLKLFNRDLLSLVEGEEVEMPRFNFVTGLREMSGKTIRLEKKSILILEGIHGLSPHLTHLIPDKKKYKVYISALTQLNMDSHNRISSMDTRLLRRMVRDHRTRGKTLEETFELWPNVQRGERKHIYPYQDLADYAMDSSLIYEVAVLKKYIMKLFKDYDPCGKYYKDIKRLEAFLKYFREIDNEENIPTNSILREFIGRKGEEE